jgi:RNA 2',3'-cyclic 3'-phosphodiesterase
MKRLFAAVKIHPSPEFLKIYNDLRSGLKFADIKWVKPEIIHVTLKFFGETEERKIAEISRVLKEVALHHKPFSCELENVGIFGSSYSPKVIWFGIGNSEPLKNLGREVIQSCEPIGWEPDRQNFVPHLTIARIKNVPDKNLFQSMIDRHKSAFIQEFSVAEFHLYESILQREGPVYRILETYGLREINV